MWIFLEYLDLCVSVCLLTYILTVLNLLQLINIAKSEVPPP